MKKQIVYLLIYLSIFATALTFIIDAFEYNREYNPIIIKFASFVAGSSLSFMMFALAKAINKLFESHD